MDFPRNFRAAVFDFLISPKERIDLPRYLGHSLRGGFSQAFRKISCGLKDKRCDQCLLSENCAYSYIFETPLPRHSGMAKKYPYAPYPFVLEPPLEMISAHQIAFGLVLIGKAIDYLAHFICAFAELGRRGTGKGRGRFQLLEVRSDRKTVYSTSRMVLGRDYREVTSEEILSRPLKGVKRLEVRFLTPTRMKSDSKPTSRIDFSTIIRNLLQRVALLSYFHCGEEIDGDMKGMIDRAKKITLESSELSWYDWERFPKKQRKKLKMGGIVGVAKFSGNLDEFLPYLSIGELVHIGKGTSLGLGRFRLRNETSA